MRYLSVSTLKQYAQSLSTGECVNMKGYVVHSRKTKIKAITLAYHKGYSHPGNQSKLEVTTCSQREARENVCE